MEALSEHLLELGCKTSVSRNTDAITATVFVTLEMGKTNTKLREDYVTELCMNQNK